MLGFTSLCNSIFKILFLLQDKALDSEQITDDEWRLPKRALTGFARLDAKYFMPFFTINLPRAVSLAVIAAREETQTLVNLERSVLVHVARNEPLLETFTCALTLYCSGTSVKEDSLTKLFLFRS